MIWKLIVLFVAFSWSLWSSWKHAVQFLVQHKYNLVNWLKARQGGAGRLLLVIAHPDDECMFFAPAVLAFIKAGWKVDILCITTGNADGLGKVRVKELECSAKVLGIDQLHIHDDQRNLPDSISVEWDTDLLAKYLLEFLEEHADIDAILTFDPAGISGHLNHRAVCQAVRLALCQLQDALDLFELETVPLLVKYIGMTASIYEAVNVSVEATLRTEGIELPEETLVAVFGWPEALRYALGAMRMHRSQLVWFRYLYLLFSRYCHVNTVRLKRPLKS